MTTATFYLRPRFSASVALVYPTTGRFNLALRFVAGRFSSRSDGIDSNSVKRKSLMPDRSTPFLDGQGLVATDWYRWLQFQYEKKLGGDNAPTLPQVTAAVVTAQVGGDLAAGTIASIVQVVENNAAVQAASNQALVAASVPGATQIPAPIVNVPDYEPPERGDTESKY